MVTRVQKNETKAKSLENVVTRLYEMHGLKQRERREEKFKAGKICFYFAVYK